MESRLTGAEALEETPILSTDSLEVSFDGFKALRGVNFNLFRGELRFLIGPNGAGKTTLLDVLCGKVKPSKGRVIFHGTVDFTRYSEHRIARLGVGRKFQAPSVFSNLSVLDNLLLSMKQSRGLFDLIRARTDAPQRERMQEILQLIGLEHRGQELAGALAHGEKQWLEIGMLLMQKPEVLLLDEPAAGMTDEETEKTGELLHRISSNQSVIVVEHDMDFVRQFAKTVTVMHEGTVLMEGTMNEVQSSDKVAEVYLGRRGERNDAH
jgi:urea transport system ATP-binding protein